MRNAIACCTVVLALGTAGCSDETNGAPKGPGTPDASSDAVTYFQHIRPLIDEKCSLCHVEGGVAPMPLQTFEDVAAWAPQIRAEVASGRMPPWFAAEGCNDYVGDRSLTEEQRTLVGRWVDQGAQAGDETAAAPLPTHDVPPFYSDVALAMPEAYTPRVTPDEYRCFLIPWPETEPTYITGVAFRPGNEALVHHSVMYIATPEAMVNLQALDDADPEPGYECFTASASTVGLSLIGAIEKAEAGQTFPEGTGIRIEPGSTIVMQQHYNTLHTGKPEPDRSTVEFSVDRQVERPAQAAWFTDINWLLGSMLIPSGESDVGFWYQAPVPALSPGPMALHWADLHMHQLGTSGRLDLVHADGSQECLLQIDDWQFDWQETYFFKREVVVQPGDQFSIECRFDNSAENQIILDGERVAPRDVNWGDGSQDEMCLGNFLISAPSLDPIAIPGNDGGSPAGATDGGSTEPPDGGGSLEDGGGTSSTRDAGASADSP